MRDIFIIIILSIVAFSCNQNNEKLPYVGPKELADNGDTIYYTIPEFNLVNQDGENVNNESMKGNIYVADFFFTSCPGICPTMTTQMKRIHDRFIEDDRVKLLSHTLDPKYDTLAALRHYAEKIGANTNKWQFLYGDKAKMYELSTKGYLIAVQDDEEAPGGIAHSGYFTLVDHEGKVRGYYIGIEADKVDKLMEDIDILLQEINQDA